MKFKDIFKGGVTVPPKKVDLFGEALSSMDQEFQDCLNGDMRNTLARNALGANAAAANTAMQGSLSGRVMVGAAQTTGVGVNLGPSGTFWRDWNAAVLQSPTPNPVELPAFISPKVWKRTDTDETRVEIGVHCVGGPIHLTFDRCDIIGAERPTAREVIENLQAQLVRQLALVSLEED